MTRKQQMLTSSMVLSSLSYNVPSRGTTSVSSLMAKPLVERPTPWRVPQSTRESSLKLWNFCSIPSIRRKRSEVIQRKAPRNPFPRELLRYQVVRALLRKWSLFRGISAWSTLKFTMRPSTICSSTKTTIWGLEWKRTKAYSSKDLVKTKLKISMKL